MEHKPSVRTVQRKATEAKAKRKLRLVSSAAMVSLMCLVVSEAMFLVIITE